MNYNQRVASRLQGWMTFCRFKPIHVVIIERFFVQAWHERNVGSAAARVRRDPPGGVVDPRAPKFRPEVGRMGRGGSRHPPPKSGLELDRPAPQRNPHHSFAEQLLTKGYAEQFLTKGYLRTHLIQRV